jgi:hypothetical protein
MGKPMSVVIVRITIEEGDGDDDHHEDNQEEPHRSPRE